MGYRFIIVGLLGLAAAGAALMVDWESGTAGEVGSIIFACLLIFGIPVAIVLFRVRCSACGRFFALRPTGEKRPGPGLSRQEHVRCRHCGHTEWRRESRGE